MATGADTTGITREITSNAMVTSDTALSATPTTPIIKITTNIILSTSDVATDSALISTLTARNNFESSVILTTGPTTSNSFESRTIFTARSSTDFTQLADARQQENDDSGSNNAGIIAGCIVAFIVFIVVVCIIIFLILYCTKKKKKGEYLRCIQQLCNHLFAYVRLSVVSVHAWSDYCSYAQWGHCIYTVDFVAINNTI